MAAHGLITGECKAGARGLTGLRRPQMAGPDEHSLDEAHCAAPAGGLSGLSKTQHESNKAHIRRLEQKLGELETRNQALEQECRQRTEKEAALHQNEAQLRAIFDNEPECVKLLGADGSLLEMNPAGLRMIEADSFQQVENCCLYLLVVEEHRQAFKELNEKVFAGGSGTLEFQVVGLKGGRRWLETHANPLRDASGKVTALLGITRDITERKQAEAALLASEVRYRRLFESAKDGILILDAETGLVVDVNPFLVELLGFSHEAFLGKKVWELGFLKDIIANEANFAELQQNEYIRYEDLALETSDGRRIEVEFVSNVYLVNGHKVIQCNIRDISERIRAEQRLSESREQSSVQLRALLVRLQRAREEERIRVSREIHDELGQLLTGLKMDVRWIERKLSDPGLPPALNPLLDRAVAASELADATVATVQKIAAELRSDTLDHLGLAAALTETARRFRERSGIRCVVVIEGELQALPPKIADELFYICQEALTNVARHAGATSVVIGLKSEGGDMILELRDDGVGMAAEAMSAPRSLGLLGMSERAAHCGGTITFTPNEPQGTRVTVRVPMTNDECPMTPQTP